VALQDEVMKGLEIPRVRPSRPLRSLAISFVATAALLVAVPSPAIAATTVASWHMNESSGQMTDSSGSGNHGTLSNVTRVSPGVGGRGGAYSFNGTSSRVVVPGSSSLNPGAQSISITAHVRFDVRPPPSVGDYDLVRKGSGIYKMEILRTGQAFCRFAGTNGVLTLKAGPNLADGRWHTIVCKKTSSSIKLTVDGSSSSKSGSVGSISSSSVLVLSGKPTSSEDRYKGVMDEVSIVVG
jgi:concanavalin A-like lectin/glucanase superfamily protein